MNNNTSQKKQRELNFELLRIVSMIMIVTLHYWGKSGFLDSADYKTSGFYFAWIIRSFSFCAVNCYVLITGYFMSQTEFKISRLIKTWLTVWVYSVVIYLLSSVVGVQQFEILGLIKSALPITMSAYWYVTVYFLLIIVCPIINLYIKNTNESQLKITILILVVLFCLIPTIICYTDYTGVKDGYSLYWFVVLYLCAGYIKKYGQGIKLSTSRCLIGYILFCAFLFGTKIALYFLTSSIWGEPKFTNVLFRYNSIPVFGASICLFLFFKQLKINNQLLKRFISFFAPLTFGVYLIHLHPAIKDWFWSKIVRPQNYTSSGILLIHFLCVIFVVYFTCSMVEWVRQLVIDKNLKGFLSKIDNKVSKYINKIKH